jgi:dipeptidyl aminopeptidase/acylaminoacyl peptidase
VAAPPAAATTGDAQAAAVDPSAGAAASTPAAPPIAGLPDTPHPLQIAWMRQRDYPGSELVVERVLEPGPNYERSVVSYRSDGHKIYALLTVPHGERPATGWPVVVFNHGYIPPAQYRTTERYLAYTDAFARNGYIVLKSDYRGHGSSEGEASGGYGSPDYTVDVLNGMASVRRHPAADPNRVGMWGHSMGGQITLRSMVVSKDIKAGVIWAGVVASYADRMAEWRRRNADNPNPTPSGRRSWRIDLVNQFGLPEQNPAFWASISPNSYLAELSGPLQLHHGTADSSVPVEYSQKLANDLQAIGWPSELFIYPGDNHNLSGALSQALQRSVDFFNAHVKGG